MKRTFGALVAVATLGALLAGCWTPAPDVSTPKAANVVFTGSAVGTKAGDVSFSIRAAAASAFRIQADERGATFADIKSVRIEFVPADNTVGAAKYQTLTNDVKANSPYVFRKLTAPDNLVLRVTMYDGLAGSGRVLNIGGVPSLSQPFGITDQQLTNVAMSVTLHGGTKSNGDVSTNIGVTDGAEVVPVFTYEGTTASPTPAPSEAPAQLANYGSPVGPATMMVTGQNVTPASVDIDFQTDGSVMGDYVYVVFYDPASGQEVIGSSTLVNDAAPRISTPRNLIPAGSWMVVLVDDTDGTYYYNGNAMPVNVL